MHVHNRVATLQEWSLRQRKDGAGVALVPTMGYLHEGHLSLVRLAREQGQRVVVSVFVNPTQFGPHEDFKRYPRDTDRDLMLCAAAGVDVVLLPGVEEMYAPDANVFVDETRVTETYEGAHRPGYFRGVLTVVAKLFNAALPSVAVFGEKDAQQLWLIRRMVRDLFFPLRIVAGPTAREADGLAMSSRNVYLSKEDRAAAVCLSLGLKAARAACLAGETDTSVLLDLAGTPIREARQARLDYLDVVSDDRFAHVDRILGASRMIVAARFGTTRLIDNLRLDV